MSGAPLYRDPVEDGAADPTVIWNPHEAAWWMVYTARRATAPGEDVGWVHGTSLGVASSSDHGRTWLYRGVIEGLAIEGDIGQNTFWAPEIIEVDGRFHLYVSYIVGVPRQWAGHPRVIRHYVSDDLITWEFRGTLELSSDQVIDACVYPLPEGGYRLWYKDEADGNTIWAADSADLDNWEVRGRVLSEEMALEGPYVFRLGEFYWIIADAKCQRIYRSSDLATWVYTGSILDAPSGLVAGREDDLGPGLHGQVVVAGGTAWLFYFTHPDRHRLNLTSANMRRSSIQVAALTVADGQLACARDGSVEVDLSPAEPLPLV